jgi:hypothetical protein
MSAASAQQVQAIRLQRHLEVVGQTTAGRCARRSCTPETAIGLSVGNRRAQPRAPAARCGFRDADTTGRTLDLKSRRDVHRVPV